MQFRNDINGLRAIAVLAVLLFHFNDAWAPGGFAGVDVFFVISGYLMTGIIFTGLENNRFSVFRFYLSRANRIIPPLAGFCVAVLILGYLFLPVYDFRVVGRDILGSITFTSSLIFSLKQDYFEGQENFLLHTWSLSTEWQFYIIYPVVLSLLARFLSLKVLKGLLVAGFFIGVGVSVYGTMHWPSQAYYLLPTRAWEMIMGGLAFVYPLSLKGRLPVICEMAGIALIGLSYAFISEHNPWPGYLALIPVVGTYLVIVANRQSSIITNNIVAQKIGKWSYSIYLWHWPLAVSFVYYGFDDNYRIVGLLISIVLGYLSFLVFENRKRVSDKVYSKLAAYALLMVVFGGIGGFIYQSNGIAFRQNLDGNPLIAGGLDNDYENHEGLSRLNARESFDYVLLGDSKAGHLVRGILKSGTSVKLSWYAACISMPDAVSIITYYGDDWYENCKNNYREGLENGADVILSQLWHRQEKNGFKCKVPGGCDVTGDYMADLQKQLPVLFDLYGEQRNIFILGELARPRDGKIEQCLRRKSLLGFGPDCAEKAPPVQVAAEINKVLKSIAAGYDNVHFIDPADAFCEQGECRYAIDQKSVYLPDLGHLTGFGSEILWDYVMGRIELIKTP